MPRFLRLLPNLARHECWAQAYGARRYHTVGVVLQRALILVTLFNVFCVAFWGQVCVGCGSAGGLD